MTRVGKCVGMSEMLLYAFDHINGIRKESGYNTIKVSHTRKSVKEGIKNLLSQVLEPLMVDCAIEHSLHSLQT